MPCRDSRTEGGLGVTVAGVGSIDDDAIEAADLLIVGGPTHAHGLSNASSRETARQDDRNTFDGPTLSPGLREWLPTVAEGDGRAAAAFDTRVGGAPVWLTGSAAKHVGKRLEARGYRLAVKPECFLVTRHNELVDGEIERARTWGASVAESLRVPR
jgi:hypothetical protein